VWRRSRNRERSRRLSHDRFPLAAARAGECTRVPRASAKSEKACAYERVQGNAAQGDVETAQPADVLSAQEHVGHLDVLSVDALTCALVLGVPRVENAIDFERDGVGETRLREKRVASGRDSMA
jgi:hypothetical protein